MVTWGVHMCPGELFAWFRGGASSVFLLFCWGYAYGLLHVKKAESPNRSIQGKPLAFSSLSKPSGWLGFLGDSAVKNLPANADDARDSWVRSLVGKIPWRRAWQPTPIFLPGESHGQRSLVGYSPWGHKESDKIEVTENACGQDMML